MSWFDICSVSILIVMLKSHFEEKTDWLDLISSHFMESCLFLQQKTTTFFEILIFDHILFKCFILYDWIFLEAVSVLFRLPAFGN